jgi:hypothetical protein
VKLVAPCFIAIAFGESFASRATAYSFGRTAAIKPRQHRFKQCEARGKPSELLQAPRSTGASKPNLPSRNTNHDLNCGGRGGLSDRAARIAMPGCTPMVGFSPKNGERRRINAACRLQQSDRTQDIEWRNKKQTQNSSRR